MRTPEGDPAPSWDDVTLAGLLTWERLASYLAQSGADLRAALHLYEWNTQACAAVIQTVALAEVVVRNALDQKLVAWASGRSNGRSWLDIAPLDQKARANIADARRRATRGGRDVEVHGKVVAELTFGFWRYLTTSRYLVSLWVPALHRSFPQGDVDVRVRRAQVEQAMDRIGFVRNRAAHHEPIHRRDLARDFAAAVALCEWVHPEAGTWARAVSILPAVIEARPR